MTKHNLLIRHFSRKWMGQNVSPCASGGISRNCPGVTRIQCCDAGKIQEKLRALTVALRICFSNLHSRSHIASRLHTHIITCYMILFVEFWFSPHRPRIGVICSQMSALAVGLLWCQPPWSGPARCFRREWPGLLHHHPGNVSQGSENKRVVSVHCSVWIQSAHQEHL